MKKKFCCFIAILLLMPCSIFSQQVVEKGDSTNVDSMNVKIHELDEVVVEASNRIIKTDRMIILPTAEEIKISPTFFDLLSNLMLPGIYADRVNKTLKTDGHKRVGLKINGIDVSQSEIEALMSSDIIRVEYYERPGVRLGGADAPGAVVDFIVRRSESGFLALCDLLNAPFTGFGNDMISFKFNKKKSEFSIHYNVNYREYDKRQYDKEEFFHFPTDDINRKTEGIESPFGYQVHNINATYNYTEPDKQVLNIALRNTMLSHHALNEAVMTVSNLNNAVLSQDNTQNNSYQPSLDLYFLRQLKGNQKLEFNVVANYLETNHNRNYLELTNDTLLNLQSIVAGKQYSLVEEIAYSKSFAGGYKVESGIRQRNIWEQNNYKAYSDLVKNTSSFTWLYAQLSGTLKKINYQIGLAGVRDYACFNETSYTFYAFRPTLDLKYSPNTASTFQFRSNINTNKPALSHFNNIIQSIDDFRATQGNPNIRPYKSYFNSINYTFQTKAFYSRVRFSQTYYDKPIMAHTFYDASRNQFITRNENQKNLQLYSTVVDLKLRSLFNKMLTIGLTGAYQHYESNGLYYSYKLDNFDLTAQINLVYKDFSLSFQTRTRPKSLWGETIEYDENNNQIQLRYNKEPYTIGIGMFYPFSNAWNAGSKLLSDIMPYNSWTTIKDNGHMLFVNFSWNISVGRKFESGKKNLNNEGTSSNIMTVSSN